MQRRWIRLSLAVFLVGGLFLMIHAQAFASEPYVKQTKKDCMECHVDKYYPGKDFFGQRPRRNGIITGGPSAFFFLYFVQEYWGRSMSGV
jgi:hypothetical protein